MGARWILAWLRVELAYQCYWRWTRYRDVAHAHTLDRDPLLLWIRSLKPAALSAEQ